MKPIESEEPQDDLEFEITDLDKTDGDRPVADAYEQQLALQWAKQQGVSIIGVNG